jgi:hypothetical protein
MELVRRRTLLQGPLGKERNAVISSLLGRCWQHGINPSDYLKDLFTRLPSARPTQIKDFTAAAWAQYNGKHKALPTAA